MPEMALFLVSFEVEGTTAGFPREGSANNSLLIRDTNQ